MRVQLIYSPPSPEEVREAQDKFLAQELQRLASETGFDVEKFEEVQDPHYLYSEIDLLVSLYKEPELQRTHTPVELEEVWVWVPPYLELLERVRSGKDYVRFGGSTRKVLIGYMGEEEVYLVRYQNQLVPIGSSSKGFLVRKKRS